MAVALDVILAADSLQRPLTGIGRYTYELAKRLAAHKDIARLRYFSMGSWVANPLADLDERQPGSTRHSPDRPSLRTILATNRAAVRVYQALTPTLYGWRLRGNNRAIYHSPNFIVPPFNGAVVSTVHDLSHILHPKFHPQARVDFMNLAFDVSMKRTDHVITDSETVRTEFLNRFNWAPERVTAIALGVDPEYHPRSADELHAVLAQWGLRFQGYVLYVGSIEPRKNLERLLKAYSTLPLAMRREHPLVMAGSRGWHSDQIHKQMEIGRAEGWVHYLSFVSQAHLPLLYAGAALFAYPSLYAGFGLPIAEAMASGVPVITSRVSCMPEVAGGAARLVNPLDVEDVATALRDSLDSRSWRNEARQLGLARAINFSWKDCAQRTVGVYKSIAPL